jgi:hypothetical protein
LLARHADKLILHSNSAVSVVESTYGVRLARKAHVIPHGNYDGCYPRSQRSPLAKLPKLNDDPASINVLFFGAVRGYKGVGRLLSAVCNRPELNCRVLVAGRPFDDESRMLVEDAVRRDSRVQALLGFVADDEVASLFDWADIVAVPFERTLTSGSVVLALTMGRPVLVSSAARVLDLLDEKNAVFFGSDAELSEKLSSLRKEDLRSRRCSCRATADVLSWGRIGRLTLSAYSGK